MAQGRRAMEIPSVTVMEELDAEMHLKAGDFLYIPSHTSKLPEELNSSNYTYWTFDEWKTHRKRAMGPFTAETFVKWMKFYPNSRWVKKEDLWQFLL